MTEYFGGNAKLYYKVGGQADGGEWIEATHVRNVTIPMETSAFDAKDRSTFPWSAEVPVVKSLNLDFDILLVEADPAYTALQEAWMTGGMIGFKVLDKLDGQGPQADYCIFTFSRSEQLEEGIVYTVGARLTKSATPPSWVSGL